MGSPAGAVAEPAELAARPYQAGTDHGADAEYNGRHAQAATAEQPASAGAEPGTHAGRSRRGDRGAGHALRAHVTKRRGNGSSRGAAVATPAPVLSRPSVPSPAPDGGRDVGLDLLRGLAIAILVVNHVHLESGVGYATTTVLSAAEVLVAVSGIVAGMVFGRRWITLGPRATTRLLLARARKLYIATVAVIALVGLLVAAPWVDTGVMTASPRMAAGTDLYAFDGALRTLLAVVTLEAGPWQFSILGLFIVLLALTPGVLWALERGWWPHLLVLSWALVAVGRTWDVDVLPTQSERAFPILIWQALFVHGLLVGYHRAAIARFLARRRRPIVAAVVVAALAALAVRLQMAGLDPLGLDRVLGYAPADWEVWRQAHFDKTTLDLARVAILAAIAGGAYLAFCRWQHAAERSIGRVLLPLGRNSFYVFIMHVFLCLGVALVPGLAGAGIGIFGNAVVEVACLALLWTMVSRRFLFSIVPR